MLESLRSELERLYDLEQLEQLARDHLDIAPESLGGGGAKGSFVVALVERCQKEGAVEALCDAIAASREGLSAELQKLRRHGHVTIAPLRPGDRLGSLTVEQLLGHGPLGSVYGATGDGAAMRLKVFRAQAALHRPACQRLLTASRMVDRVEHSGVPTGFVSVDTDGRFGIAHHAIEGQPLSDRRELEQPSKLRDVWPLLRDLLEALCALHARRLAHGDLKPENVIVARAGESDQRVTLIDAGTQFLWASAPGARIASEANRCVAPELLRGEIATPSSDVYSVGAIMYELLAGRPVFEGSADDQLLGHLARDPEPLSFAAPRAWVSAELDELVLHLLDKDARHRPRDAEAVLDMLETIAGHSVRRDSTFPDEELDERVRALSDAPADEMAAAVLEAAIDQGADPVRVAEAMREVAERLGSDAESLAAKRRLLTRAAALYEVVVSDQPAAERTLLSLLEVDPANQAARAALERVYRHQAKYDELVEVLIEQAEGATDSAEKAEVFAKVGSLFATKLDDVEQALVAYAHAFCEDPSQTAHADEIERLAGRDEKAWKEVLAACFEASSRNLPADRKNQLLVSMGHWYDSKVARPDLALQCFQAVLLVDPAHELALKELAAIYRRAQQWKELAEVLVLRASAAVTPALARDLRAEAAEILERRLGDADSARRLYEHVVAEDPSHTQAAEALSRLYERSGDLEAIAQMLDEQARALSGDARQAALCRLATLEAEQRHNADRAIQLYRAVLAEHPASLDALRGLDRVLARTGRYPELLEILQRQLELAVTPHQKLQLLERVAVLHEEEFLDKRQAIAVLEQILEIDRFHAGALSALARHYRSLQMWPALASIYERQVRAAGDRDTPIEVSLELARLYDERLGRPDRALGVLQAVLKAEPANREALDAIATLRAKLGDEQEAVAALEELAETAASPESRAGQYLRVAKMLEEQGDLEGAVQRYKRALEASPGDVRAAQGLRAALVAQGDVEAALEVLDREIERASSDTVKADRCAELARLLLQHRGDAGRAEAAASRALSLDPTSVPAHVVLGDVAFDQGRHEVARQHFVAVMKHATAFDGAEQARILGRYLKALAECGAVDEARLLAEERLRRAPDDFYALREVSHFVFSHGDAARAHELNENLLDRHEERLEPRDRAAALYRLGETARSIGKLEDAIAPLEEAASLDPEAVLPLRSLAKVLEEKQDWLGLVQVLRRRLERVKGEERTALLIEIGDLAGQTLGDPTGAAQSYLAALADRPGDRRILLKLMQLYSEKGEWEHLVDVIRKLVDLAGDGGQKAKYLRTAARVVAYEMGDYSRAIELLDEALSFDDTDEELVQEAVELRKSAGRFQAAKELLERQIGVASERRDRAQALRYMSALAELHLGQLEVDEAIAINEAAKELDPRDPKWDEVLAELYATDPARYLERAVATQERRLANDPFRPEPYEALQQFYGDVRRPDGVWCACQALVYLHRASPEQEMYFKRRRHPDVLASGARVSQEDWELLVHPDVDPLLTKVFSLIQPTIVLGRTRRLEDLGYREEDAMDPAQRPHGVVRALMLGANVLRMELPTLFYNERQARGLAMLSSRVPALALGKAAVSRKVPIQRAAFVGATHLACFRTGLYVRYLVPTPAGLKAWMLAAMRLIAPKLTMPAEIEGPGMDAHRLLDERLSGSARDRLAQPIHQLLQRGARVDLSRWIAGVDMTTDRVGLLLSDDLHTAIEVTEASGDSGAVSAAQRIKELLRYSVSSEYLKLRERMKIGVGWRPGDEKLSEAPPPSSAQAS